MDMEVHLQVGVLGHLVLVEWRRREVIARLCEFLFESIVEWLQLLRLCFHLVICGIDDDENFLWWLGWHEILLNPIYIVICFLNLLLILWSLWHRPHVALSNWFFSSSVRFTLSEARSIPVSVIGSFRERAAFSSGTCFMARINGLWVFLTSSTL